jgi:hypothetical protein
VCPQCVSVLSHRRPRAGVKNIVTEMGVHGQVDLIDFQSMPDGNFKYLLNYIDHGVKRLTSIPLVSKQVSSVAFALFTIFTNQGPPSILQTDNDQQGQINLLSSGKAGTSSPCICLPCSETSCQSVKQFGCYGVVGCI